MLKYWRLVQTSSLLSINDKNVRRGVRLDEAVHPDGGVGGGLWLVKQYLNCLAVLHMFTYVINIYTISSDDWTTEPEPFCLI